MKKYYTESRRRGISYVEKKKKKRKKSKAKWSGHILRRNCLLTGVIEGKLEGRDRRGRRRKKLLDGIK
jgi:hypothetical protein